MIKNPIEMITFRGGEFRHRIKHKLTLKPFDNVFDNCKNRWEVMKNKIT